MTTLKNIGYLGIAVGVLLLCFGGLTLVNHGVPREPLSLVGQ